jgi:hypothetical protein
MSLVVLTVLLMTTSVVGGAPISAGTRRRLAPQL